MLWCNDTKKKTYFHFLRTYFYFVYRSGKRVFEKNAAPILYVAGIEVNVVAVSLFFRLSVCLCLSVCMSLSLCLLFVSLCLSVSVCLSRLNSLSLSLSLSLFLATLSLLPPYSPSLFPYRQSMRVRWRRLCQFWTPQTQTGWWWLGGMGRCWRYTLHATHYTTITLHTTLHTTCCTLHTTHYTFNYTLHYTLHYTTVNLTC